MFKKFGWDSNSDFISELDIKYSQVVLYQILMLRTFILNENFIESRAFPSLKYCLLQIKEAEDIVQEGSFLAGDNARQILCVYSHL